jgi:Na+-translocating ferredoxin:NAD+ oxidoreductase RnfD subunit
MTAAPVPAPTPSPAPSPATRDPSRTLTIGRTAYPVFLPSIRDPRLHVATVLITIQILGQIGLHFRVSVPQILASIITCAIIEIALTFRSSKAFVWPASAMLTGNGVALILRVVGTPPDDPWNTYAWWVFAIVGGLSLLTKYVIKYRGTHVFNPSNIGLVVTFVVLGSSLVEPLDFWWAPLTNPLMVIAYVVIIGGGLLITRRLRLLALAATFWVTLTIGTGILAGSGHCMTANWAFAPVCGFDFWRIIVTSPEVMIFLFFMITDPKTTPSGQVGRILFGFLVAVASVLLMAPQTNEFGTKVGLLAGLVLICAARPILDRLVPEPKSAADHFGSFASRLAIGKPGAGALRAAAGIAVLLVAVFGLSAGIVAAGTPARGQTSPDIGEVLSDVPHQVDPATFPAITVGTDVTDWDNEITEDGARDIVQTLAENLEIENQAVLRHDDTILTAVDHGDRLNEMRSAISTATAGGTTTVSHYAFDDVSMRIRQPKGLQTGLSLGLDSTGTVTQQTYDASGALVSTVTKPFDLTFAMRRATGARWLNVAVLPRGG